MIAFLLFLFGLFVGSFLNVVVDRLPREESFFVGRSHCDFCKHVLEWYDLVPLFSFLQLGGRCRYCKKFIGWKYPTIEITTGVLFAMVYLLSGAHIELLLLYLGILSCLIVIFFTDLFSGIIPDAVLIMLFLFAIIRSAFLLQHILPFFLTALSTGLFFLTIFLLTKGKGMGFGDVKYAPIMGFLLGFPFIIPSLYIAFLTGAVSALILVIARRKKMRSTIPLGPFLVLGTTGGLFWGAQLWVFMQRLLGI